MTDDREETIEEYTKRLAYNRYQMRVHFKWRLNDTSADDWAYAQEVVQRELHQDRTRFPENSKSDKILPA